MCSSSRSYVGKADLTIVLSQQLYPASFDARLEERRSVSGVANSRCSPNSRCKIRSLQKHGAVWRGDAGPSRQADTYQGKTGANDGNDITDNRSPIFPHFWLICLQKRAWHFKPISVVLQTFKQIQTFQFCHHCICSLLPSIDKCTFTVHQLYFEAQDLDLRDARTVISITS